MEVSKGTAEFFKQQCIGEFSGHMSMIPNNPTLFGLLQAHGCDRANATTDDEEFIKFLRACADALESD